MPRPAVVPRYVAVVERTMDECFGIDLWKLGKIDQNRLILAACDAEIAGDPEDAESIIEAVVYDTWREIKRSRRR